jgi:hypothetical protein
VSIPFWLRQVNWVNWGNWLSSFVIRSHFRAAGDQWIWIPFWSGRVVGSHFRCSVFRCSQGWPIIDRICSCQYFRFIGRLIGWQVVWSVNLLCSVFCDCCHLDMFFLEKNQLICRLCLVQVFSHVSSHSHASSQGLLMLLMLLMLLHISHASSHSHASHASSSHLILLHSGSHFDKWSRSIEHLGIVCRLPYCCEVFTCEATERMHAWINSFVNRKVFWLTDGWILVNNRRFIIVGFSCRFKDRTVDRLMRLRCEVICCIIVACTFRFVSSAFLLSALPDLTLVPYHFDLCIASECAWAKSSLVLSGPASGLVRCQAYCRIKVAALMVPRIPLIFLPTRIFIPK